MTTLVMATVTSISWLSLRREQQTFRKELEQQAEILLDSLTVTTADALYLLDADFLEEIMTRLGAERVLVAGRVYEKEGRVIAVEMHYFYILLFDKYKNKPNESK